MEFYAFLYTRTDCRLAMNIHVGNWRNIQSQEPQQLIECVGFIHSFTINYAHPYIVLRKKEFQAETGWEAGYNLDKSSFNANYQQWTITLPLPNQKFHAYLKKTKQKGVMCKMLCKGILENCFKQKKKKILFKYLKKGWIANKHICIKIMQLQIQIVVVQHNIQQVGVQYQQTRRSGSLQCDFQYLIKLHKLHDSVYS